VSVLLRDELVSVLGYGGYCIPHLSAAPSSAESVEGRSTSALEDQTALFERHIHEKQSLQGRILSLEQQLEIGQSLISTARSAWCSPVRRATIGCSRECTRPCELNQCSTPRGNPGSAARGEGARFHAVGICNCVL
jgi:hypothetical protein